MEIANLKQQLEDAKSSEENLRLAFEQETQKGNEVNEKRISVLEKQVHSLKQQLKELREEAKSHREAAKRAERRFQEADAAAKSLASDSQSMANLVHQLREKSKQSGDQVKHVEMLNAQLQQQVQKLEQHLSECKTQPQDDQQQQQLASNDRIGELEQEVERLQNKVRFMTEQFELSVSRSALLERNVREKEEQIEKLSKKVASSVNGRQSHGVPIDSRSESPLLSEQAHQYYEALPQPVKRAFENVRRSNAAAATLSAGQRFQRIVEDSPVANTVRRVCLFFQCFQIGMVISLTPLSYCHFST